jgi:hypothetical protein
MIYNNINKLSIKKVGGDWGAWFGSRSVYNAISPPKLSLISKAKMLTSAICPPHRIAIYNGLGFCTKIRQLIKGLILTLKGCFLDVLVQKRGYVGIIGDCS